MNQLNQRNRIIEKYILLVVDSLAVFMAYFMALWTRFGSVHSSLNPLNMGVCLGFLLATIAINIGVTINTSLVIRGYLVEFGIVLKNNIIIVVIVATMLYMTQSAEFFSRMVWGYIFIYNSILEFCFHVIVKHILKKYMTSERSKTKLMVIADANGAQAVIKKLENNLPVNYDIVQIVLLQKMIGERLTYKGREVTPYVMDDKESFIKAFVNIPLDEVFFDVSIDKLNELKEIIQSLEAMGIVCHCNIDLQYWKSRESQIGKFADYTVISYSMVSMDTRKKLVKRLMDILGGIVGLIILALLFPFVALAIKLDSKGPIFFCQTRIGKNGRRFRIYKFRSMYIDAEERKKQLIAQNEMTGFMFKLKDDPRITPVGKFLRKTSIDELPQFYNILKGDMSLIGTRPPTQDEFEEYSPYYRRRLSMTPGLTGLWQVSGRSEIKDFDEVVKLDLEYIDKWSLSLDIKILFKTIIVVLFGKGAK